jgi:hypothetical protein
MTELADRFARDGCIFPIPVLSVAEAARAADAYVDFEARGKIRDDRPGLKLHCVFRWAYDIVAHPAVLDVVEQLIGPGYPRVRIATVEQTPERSTLRRLASG